MPPSRPTAANCDGVDAGELADIRQEVRIFDRLPPAVRQAIAASGDYWDVEEIDRAWQYSRNAAAIVNRILG